MSDFPRIAWRLRWIRFQFWIRGFPLKQLGIMSTLNELIESEESRPSLPKEGTER